MGVCNDNNVNFSLLEGKKFDRPAPPLFTQELTSIAQTGASGSTLPTMRLTDAGSDLEQIRGVANSYGGVPVILAVAFRFTQTVAVTAAAGATAGRVLYAPFAERRARTTLNWSPGKKADVYFRTTPRSVGQINDRMAFAVAPVIVRRVFNELGVPWGERLSRPGEQQSTLLGVGPAAQVRPLYSFAPPQLRIVYNGTSAVAEPVDGSPYGDLLVIPLTMDGIGGNIAAAGIQLSKITDLNEGDWTWRFALQDETGLYYNNGAGATFGDTTVTPILIYRVERPDANGDVVEGQVWDDTEGFLPAADNVKTTFGAADVQGLSFLGWMKRVQTDDTDSGNGFFVTADTGPAPDYTPQLRMIPFSLPPATNFYSRGRYLSVGDGVREEFPNNIQALGARAITDFNSANGFSRELVNMSDCPPESYFAELQDFNASGARSATTSITAGGFVVHYGADYATGALVPTIDSTATAYKGGLADGNLNSILWLGGLQVYPMAYTNPMEAGFPGLAGRSPGDDRLIMVTRVGNWTQAQYTAGGSSVTWPTSCIRKRGSFDSCTAKDSNPVPANGSAVLFKETSANAAIGTVLTPSVSVPVSSK